MIIKARVLSPTNTQSARIKVTADESSQVLTVPFNYSLTDPMADAAWRYCKALWPTKSVSITHTYTTRTTNTYRADWS